MRKKQKEEAGPGSGSYMMTFTNLMILLLAFFIVLVTFTTVDKKKKRLAFNSLFGSFGFKTGGQAVIGSSKGGDITVGEAPIYKEEIELTKLENVVFANGLESDVEVRREADKNVIVISNRVLFAPRSSKIPNASIKFLSDLAAVLKDGPGRIQLKGHADDTENIFEPDPTKSTITLSTGRALAIFHFFINEGKIPVDRLVAHGFAGPLIKEGSSRTKKVWQGQVEIVIDYRQKVPFRFRVNKKGTRLLDYKGFLFKRIGDRDERP